MVKTGTLSTLGDELKAVRQIKGLSRHAVAAPAKISAAYLQKLEAGAVKSPSPHVLHRIACVLEVSYMRLMQLAGYILPPSENAGGATGRNLIWQALQAEELTEEELRAVAAFVSHLKLHRRTP